MKLNYNWITCHFFDGCEYGRECGCYIDGTLNAQLREACLHREISVCGWLEGRELAYDIGAIFGLELVQYRSNGELGIIKNQDPVEYLFGFLRD